MTNPHLPKSTLDREWLRDRITECNQRLEHAHSELKFTQGIEREFRSLEREAIGGLTEPDHPIREHFYQNEHKTEAETREVTERALADLDHMLNKYFADRKSIERRIDQIKAERQGLIDQVELRERQLADEQAQWQKRMVRAGCVVATLTVLAGIVAVVVMETGSGSPNRGDEVSNSGQRLGGDACDRLRGARPSFGSWSSRGSDNYDVKVDEQQARIAAVAMADQHAAKTVAAQADQVERARGELHCALAILVAGIAVAVVLTAAWEAAGGTPAEQAYEIVLIGFGAVLALTVTTLVVEVLVALDDAGTRTEKSLNNVIEAYRWVVDDALAKLPAGEGSIGSRPKSLVPKAFKSRELFSEGCDASYTAAADAASTSGGRQCRQGVITALISNQLAHNLLPQQNPDSPGLTPSTLDELAELHRQTATLCSNGYPGQQQRKSPVAQTY